MPALALEVARLEADQPAVAVGIAVGHGHVVVEGHAAVRPAPWGSRLTRPGSATAAAVPSMTSPFAGQGPGPTDFELSPVAGLLPASTVRPTFFGLTEMMPLARFWATSVSPTVTTPSS